MDGIKVEIDKDKVNEAITQSIIDSAIGDEMRREIKEYLNRASRAYDNPIKAIVERVVQEQIYKLVVSEYTDQIQEEIRKLLTQETVAEITGKAFQAMLDKQFGR